LVSSIFGTMRLLDQISSSELPFIVTNNSSGANHRLQGPADFAHDLHRCSLRYVLTDELVKVCTALAFSRGAKTLDCADLIHISAPSVWIEWCDAVHRRELAKYAFQTGDSTGLRGGRRGALLKTDALGRKGSIKVFWSTGANELELFASPLTVLFDLDVTENPLRRAESRPIHRDLIVANAARDEPGILERCFTFRFEESWASYYDDHQLSASDLVAIERHTLGTTADAIPIMLVFFLLLSARSALSQRKSELSNLNRARMRIGKRPLLEHIEVHAPLIPEYSSGREGAPQGSIRRGPRLHQVRGHLVRRGNTLYWRIPHLRGHARWGVVKSRTVSWALENAATSAGRSNAEIS
jgi:hypothetical protein